MIGEPDAEGNKRDTATRRVARRLGVPERDVADPDAIADLRHRVPWQERIEVPRLPLVEARVTPRPATPRVDPPPYRLERDVQPAHLQRVDLDTDVAMELERGVHAGPRRDRAARRPQGEDEHGAT